MLVGSDDGSESDGRGDGEGELEDGEGVVVGRKKAFVRI